jgi:hypothetical protein
MLRKLEASLAETMDKLQTALKKAEVDDTNQQELCANLSEARALLAHEETLRVNVLAQVKAAYTSSLRPHALVA